MENLSFCEAVFHYLMGLVGKFFNGIDSFQELRTDKRALQIKKGEQEMEKVQVKRVGEIQEECLHTVPLAF